MPKDQDGNDGQPSTSGLPAPQPSERQLPQHQPQPTSDEGPHAPLAKDQDGSADGQASSSSAGLPVPQPPLPPSQPQPPSGEGPTPCPPAVNPPASYSSRHKPAPRSVRMRNQGTCTATDNLRVAFDERICDKCKFLFALDQDPTIRIRCKKSEAEAKYSQENFSYFPLQCLQLDCSGNHQFQLECEYI